MKEHNKKYQDLLKEKLLLEDKLKEQLEKEKSKTIAEYEKRMKDALTKSSLDERNKYEKLLEKQVF